MGEPARKIGDYPMTLKTEHVAEILGMSKWQASELCSAKKIPHARKVGRIWCVRRDLFWAWLGGS